MDRDVLMHQMRNRFVEEFAKAPKALEDAPDGHWIEASEMAFRDAALTVAREGLQLAVQAKVDADPTAQAAAFSPSEPGRQRSSARAQSRRPPVEGADRDRNGDVATPIFLVARPCEPIRVIPIAHARVHHRTVGNAGLPPRVGQRLAHRIGTDGSHVQIPDVATEADRDEMGSVPRRRGHEPRGPTRIRPMGQVVDPLRSLMPQSMATPSRAWTRY